MIENVEQQKDNFKAVAGIGLYKIRYEMDVQGSTKEQNYIAGVISYSSEEAVKTLVEFAKLKVKGFKGLKIEEVAYEGGCHAMSDSVRKAIIKGAKEDGTVVGKSQYDEVVAELTQLKENNKKAYSAKKSIIPKEKE